MKIFGVLYVFDGDIIGEFDVFIGYDYLVLDGVLCVGGFVVLLIVIGE